MADNTHSKDLDEEEVMEKDNVEPVKKVKHGGKAKVLDNFEMDAIRNKVNISFVLL